MDNNDFSTAALIGGTRDERWDKLQTGDCEWALPPLLESLLENGSPDEVFAEGLRKFTALAASNPFQALAMRGLLAAHAGDERRQRQLLSISLKGVIDMAAHHQFDDASELFRLTTLGFGVELQHFNELAGQLDRHHAVTIFVDAAPRPAVALAMLNGLNTVELIAKQFHGTASELANGKGQRLDAAERAACEHRLLRGEDAMRGRVLPAFDDALRGRAVTYRRAAGNFAPV